MKVYNQIFKGCEIKLKCKFKEGIASEEKNVEMNRTHVYCLVL